MKWPAQSPDLNPIEMLWINVEKEVKEKKAKNLNNLYRFIKEIWDIIPIDRFIGLIESMHCRCAEVIKQKGMATKY